jgi:hypothetical protein
VTLAGESAGAMSVGMHLASPVSIQRNLFQGAILESDPFAFQYALWFSWRRARGDHALDTHLTLSSHRSPLADEAREYTTFLGAYLGCPEDDLPCYLSKCAQSPRTVLCSRCCSVTNACACAGRPKRSSLRRAGCWWCPGRLS